MVPVNDELRAELIDAAGRLLAEHGPAGLSLRKVAAAAGTSTMAVYTRFGDKQALLTAMHREGFERLGAHLVGAGRASAAGADPLDGLLALGRAYRQAALANRHVYQLMFGTAVPDFRPDAAGDAAARATYDPLVAGVSAAVEAGRLIGDPERIALHLWVVAHGAVSLELSGQLPVDDPAGHYDQALILAGLPFIPAAAPHEGAPAARSRSGHQGAPRRRRAPRT